MSPAAAPDGFSASLRREADDLWQEILGHPFVRGLGDGTLARERYAAYLREDYPYLREYARAMALGAGLAEDLEAQRFFTEQAHLTLTVEMDLHRQAARAFGLTEDDLEAVQPDAATRAYGAHLVGTARAGPEADLVAALLPCAAGYVEIAQHLADQGLPEDPAYRAWIEAYTSDAMKALARWLERRLDGHAADADDATRARWRALYRTSTEAERAFFTQAWERPAASR